MIPPKITQLPPAPVRADAPVDFSSKADAMVGALQPFADEANILAEFVNTRADNAESSASSVEGVESAVSADRVLSQQAASNAAGSAAAAATSAGTASTKASEAQSSANASEASAVRAEDAAQYVEGISGGAAPINNPNFQGVVKVNYVPLGTAATRNVGTASGNVMEVGAFGVGRTTAIDSIDFNTLLQSGVYSIAAHAEWNSSTNRPSQDTSQQCTIIVNNPSNTTIVGACQQVFTENGKAFFRTSRWSGVFTPWREIYHTGNLLQTTGTSTDFPMSQKAVSDAINEATETIDVSGPRPVKDHGPVATAGSQTVVCNVQESDFHILDMSGANTTGTLTIDFANMPDTVGKHFSWHVRLQRGGRKTVEFAQQVNWAGGVAPMFGTDLNNQDLILFYKVDSETIRGMVIDAW